MTASRLVKKTRPTNLDLQDQVAEVHECLHNVGNTVTMQGQHIVALADAMGVRLPTEDELKRGEPAKRIPRRVGGLSTWQAASGGAAVITCAMAAYKVLEPALVAAAVALHHALMSH